MPRRAKGPRLYFDKKRSSWVIRDGPRFVRTGCASGEIDRAEKLLEEFIGNKRKPPTSAATSIADILLAYATDRVPHLRTARNATYNIGSLSRWWGDKLVTDINSRACQAYAATKTPSAARVDLKVLRSAINYWHEEYGPLPAVPKIWQPPEPAPRERWLTRSEAARLLKAARHTSHLARFVLLGLHTGTRPGVIVQLQWDWIDFKSGIMRRRAIGEQERSQKRRPPVKLGRRILAHLRRWHRLDGPRVPWIVHWEGSAIKEPHGSWAQAIKRAGLPGVTPHTLRHTRATWLMQAGVDPWQAAGALGMSVRVLESVYGHHHPAFQAEAAEV